MHACESLSPFLVLAPQLVIVLVVLAGLAPIDQDDIHRYPGRFKEYLNTDTVNGRGIR